MAKKRCAIFAEGGTEQAFLQQLFVCVAGKKRIRVETIKLRGKRDSRHGSRIEISAYTPTQDYYVAIFDCGSEGNVKSDLVERYNDLCSCGFTSIIGIRDVLGKFTAADVPKLRGLLQYGVRTKPVRPAMILVIMETEAWFIAEYTHFNRINAKLSLEVAIRNLGFDPSQKPERIEGIPHPAVELHNIYSVAGERYAKEARIIERTIQAIDYDHMYLDLGAKIPALAPLIQEIDNFLT